MLVQMEVEQHEALMFSNTVAQRNTEPFYIRKQDKTIFLFTLGVDVEKGNLKLKSSLQKLPDVTGDEGRNIKFSVAN